MQISRAKITVFVEGRELDSYVYGKLCASVVPTPFGYRIIRGDSLPGSGDSGGKVKVLDFYDYLRRHGSLESNFKGVKTTTVFFVDKDVDDLKRTKKRSDHVVYTSCYDVEGDIFAAGDLQEALAVTLSIDPQSAGIVVSPSDWRRDARRLWKDWVELCVIAQLIAARGQANYGSPSRVNPNLVDAVDTALVLSLRAQLIAATSLTSATRMNRQLAAASAAVRRCYAENDGLGLFKGKWYGHILEAWARGQFPAQVNRVAGFRDRLSGHMAQSVDYEEAWAEHFKEPVRLLLSK